MNCSECQEAVGLIRKIRKHFCHPCWIQHCNFRFRKRLFELGKPRRSLSSGYREADGCIAHTPRENVLIYTNESVAGKAILTLVQKSVSFHLEGGETQYSQRLGKLPFPFFFTVLYIFDGVTDDGDVVSTLNRNNESINFLQNWLKDTKEKLPLHFPFPLVITSLEKSLSSPQLSSEKKSLFWDEIKDEKEESDRSVEENIDSILPFDIQLNRRLSLILRDIKSKTSRIDLLQCLRQKLIVTVAQELGAMKVLLPEDQTTMAVNMFSIMSTGRGAQLAEQMNLEAKVEDVDLNRPLMDLSTDDLRDYLSALNTLSVPQESKGKNKSRIDNIGRQCEEFIVTLQRDYPGTVPTLTRIGGKLELSCKTKASLLESSQVKKCKLCQRRLKELKSDDLCYGCHSIYRDMKTPSLFQELLT